VNEIRLPLCRGQRPPIQPTALYYQLDATHGSWQPATLAGSQGTNPADYRFSLKTVVPGLHTLYAYAVYGDEGTPTSAGNGSGNSPEISDVIAYRFAVINYPTFMPTRVTVGMLPMIP
jgi:hypothetical protein